MSISARLAAVALALSLVGACGGYVKSGPGPVAAALGSMAKATVAKAKARKSGGTAPVARADLEKFGKPILSMVAKSLGQQGFLTISDAKADVVTWTTSNGITFSLRNGVLIQTRGLGADLMSAQVPTVAQLMKPGGTHQRIYYFLGPDDGATRRTYDCATTVVGRETIEVIGRSHQVTHVTEVCARGNTQITNDYWVEGASVRKSLQWTSSQIGQIEFSRVID